MTEQTGILSIKDLLASRFTSAAQFGLDTINKTLQADVDYFNSQVVEQVGSLAEMTSDRQRIYGTSAAISMVEVDEFGLARSKKNLVGGSVAAPLRKFESVLAWTNDYLKVASPAELVETYLKARKGYSMSIIKQVKKAIFNKDNYSYTDQFVDNVALGIKRLVNADGAVIPDSPAGATFDGATHTHYFGTTGTGVANADIDFQVTHLTEHGHTNAVKLVIALADASAIKALTGFVTLGDGGIVYGNSDTTARKLDFSDLENQLIGYWRNSSVEVWVKPWGTANYSFVYSEGAGEKPLIYRVRPQTALQGFRIAAQFDSHPLVAQVAQAEFGFGA